MNKAKPVPIQPVRGETVYSLLCRYHRLSVNRSVHYTLAEVFGEHDRYVPHFLAPGNLQTFSDAMTAVPSLNEGRHVAANHTGLGFLTFARSMDFKETLISDMLRQGGARRALARTGLARHVASTVSRVPAFCPSCTVFDQQQLGTPIWHVEHQLVACRVCHIHGDPLVVGTVETGPTVTSRHMLVLPPVVENQSRGLRAFPDDDLASHDDFRWMAEQSHWVLRRPIEEDLSALPEFLRSELIRKGYHGPKRGLDLNAVESDLRSRLRGAFQDFFPRSNGAAASNRWAFRNSASGQPVIPAERLLLLIRLLYPTVEAAVDAMRESSAAAAVTRETAAGPTLVDSHLVHRDGQVREAFSRLGTISLVSAELDLEFVTVRQSLLRQEIPFLRRRSRVQDLKPKIVGALMQGQSPKAVAEVFEVSYSAVLDVIASDVELKKTVKQAQNIALLKKHRKALMRLLKKRPNTTRNEIRRTLPAAHIWLRNNDRDWLETALPAKRIGGQKAGKPGFRLLDIEALDREGEQSLRAAADRLRAITPPERVSRYALLREANFTSRYERNKRNLVAVARALDELEESTLESRRRRLSWAMDSIAKTDKSLSLRALERVSRLERAVIRTERVWISEAMKRLDLIWVGLAPIDDPVDELEA